MSFSASSVFASALSQSVMKPGGSPARETGGTFQPTLTEKISLARASADDQFEAGFLESFRGGVQNKLNFVVGQLQQAYNGLLQSTAAAYAGYDVGSSGNNRFLDNTNNTYTNFDQAFTGLGGATADFDGDGKQDIGNIAVPCYAANKNQNTNQQVNFRAFNQYGASLDIKQKVAITMRSEEANAPIPVLSPGLSYKVKEYETTLNQGGFWSTVNYLFAWRPSTMKYSYLDGYSQNSDAAGFDGYLSQGTKTLGGDRGDGTMLHSSDPDRIKWQEGGFEAGYVCTGSSDISGSADTAGDANSHNDVGTNADGTDDDLRFANTYYVRQRSVNLAKATYDLATWSNNGTKVSNGSLSQNSTVILNNHDDGIGQFDVVNGNNYVEGTDTDWLGRPTPLMPGGGKVQERFTSAWMGQQMHVDQFNGFRMNGNGVNPVMGNFELARFQSYQDPDETYNLNGYVNGYNMNAAEANNLRRSGQRRAFLDSSSNDVLLVDQRPQTQNSFAQLALEIINAPKYRDVFRLGMFKDVVIQGGMNSPAGGTVNGAVRLSYNADADWTNAKAVPGKGIRPGIRSELIVFQDKFSAKG